MKRSERRILRAMVRKQAWLVRRLCRYERSRVRLRGRRLHRWIKQYMHRPLSMLGECYGRQCPNNRLFYPARRRYLEEKIVGAIQSMHGSSMVHLQCIFLGSGSLFQEIVILSKICTMMRMQQLTVICYDSEYVAQDVDEEAIIKARFAQAQHWMLSIAPTVQLTLIKTHSLEQIMLVAAPTIFVAADATLSREMPILQSHLPSTAPLIFVLDACGVVQNTFD